MARRANAAPALALLSFCPIHRLKELTESEGRFHYDVNRTRSQTFSANTQKDLPWPTSKRSSSSCSSFRPR